jgi:hypothetical protein
MEPALALGRNPVLPELAEVRVGRGWSCAQNGIGQVLSQERLGPAKLDHFTTVSWLAGPHLSCSSVEDHYCQGGKGEGSQP